MLPTPGRDSVTLQQIHILYERYSIITIRKVTFKNTSEAKLNDTVHTMKCEVQKNKVFIYDIATN